MTGASESGTTADTAQDPSYHDYPESEATKAAAEFLRGLIHRASTGQPLTRDDAIAIKAIPMSMASAAIETLTRLLPEQRGDWPQWDGVNPEVIRELTEKAAWVDDERLERLVLKPLVAPWTPETWTRNGNQTRWLQRVDAANGSVPPSLAIGPRGSAFCRILAIAGGRIDGLLPKARLLIREIADDTSSIGADRRASAEPWISQLLESCLVASAKLAGRDLVSDLDPMSRREFLIEVMEHTEEELSKANADEMAEIMEDSESAWQSYLSGQNFFSKNPPSGDRMRPWSQSLRAQAKIFTGIVTAQTGHLPAVWAGHSDTIPAPNGFFEAVSAYESDAIRLATQLSADRGWLVAIDQVVDLLAEILRKASPSHEDIRTASDTTFHNLIATPPGSWENEVRLRVLLAFYRSMRHRSETPYEKPLKEPDGSEIGSVRIRTAAELRSLFVRFAAVPAAEAIDFGREIAIDSIQGSLVVSDAKWLVEATLDFCDTPKPLWLSSQEIGYLSRLLFQLRSRVPSGSAERLTVEYGRIVDHFVRLATAETEASLSVNSNNLLDRDDVSRVLTRVKAAESTMKGTTTNLRSNHTPTMRKLIRLCYQALPSLPVEESIYRIDYTEEYELYSTRLELLFLGWDV